MQNNIPIFVASDNNYASFVATTIASICDNTGSFCQFYILDGGISEENKSLISSLKQQYNNFDITFVKIEEEKYFKNFVASSYVSMATYYRFIIPELFPGISKVLYLDVDIIVNGDINELYNIDLENYIIAAVADEGNSDYIKMLKNNMDINFNSTYFNAGILLINFDKWRGENITSQLFEIEKKYHDKLLCNDQDILNNYFENNYKLLDPKYNSMIYREDMLIRHYYGAVKPWMFIPDICIKKYDEFKLFWDIARKTPFYDELVKKCKYVSFHHLQLLDLYQRLGKKKLEAQIENA